MTEVPQILAIYTHYASPQLSAWSHRVWCTGMCQCSWPRCGRGRVGGWWCCASLGKSATRMNSGPSPLPQRSNWLLAGMYKGNKCSITRLLHFSNMSVPPTTLFSILIGYDLYSKAISCASFFTLINLDSSHMFLSIFFSFLIFYETLH